MVDLTLERGVSCNSQFVAGCKGRETPKPRISTRISNYRNLAAVARCLRKLKINWTKRKAERTWAGQGSVTVVSSVRGQILLFKFPNNFK